MSKEKSYNGSKIYPHPTHVGYMIEEQNYNKKDTNSDHPSQASLYTAEAILSDILEPLDTLIFGYYKGLSEIRTEAGKVLFHVVPQQSGTLFDPTVYDREGNLVHSGRGEVALYDYLFVDPDDQVLIHLKRYSRNNSAAYKLFTGREEKLFGDMYFNSNACSGNYRYCVTPMSLFSGAKGRSLITAVGEISRCWSPSRSIKFFSPDLDVLNIPKNNASGQNPGVGNLSKNNKTHVSTAKFTKSLPAVHKMCIAVIAWHIIKYLISL